jgi:hypothetical protein
MISPGKSAGSAAGWPSAAGGSAGTARRGKGGTISRGCVSQTASQAMQREGRSCCETRGMPCRQQAAGQPPPQAPSPRRRTSRLLVMAGMAAVANAGGYLAARLFIGFSLASFVACQFWCSVLFNPRCGGWVAGWQAVAGGGQRRRQWLPAAAV